MKRLICLALLLLAYGIPALGQKSNSAVQKRQYPGGVDETDLQVQKELHPPERKFHPKVIFNKELGSFEAIKAEAQPASEE